MSKKLRNLHNIPFNPARCPFFYGWVILLAAAIGTIASVPGQTFGVSAFTEPLLQSLAIERTGLSIAYTCGTIGSALLLTWGGKLYDKLGARITGVMAALCLGAVLFFLSHIDDVSAALAGPFAGAGVDRVTAFVALVFGFLMLRFWGQGILTMVARNMLMKWFDHRRGLANGFMGLLVPVAFSMTPLVFDRIVTGIGWREAWLMMGMIMLGVALFSWIFYRDNPEIHGLTPDGNLKHKPGDPQHHPARQYTLAEARRTQAFWIYTLTIAMHALYLTSISFHIVSVFDAVGIGKTRAMAIFIPSSIITVGAAFLAGWISDHVPLKYFLFVLIAGIAMSMAGIFFLHLPAGYYMVIAGNGLAGGTFGLLMTVTWPRFYGRKHLGAISGFHMSWVVAFSAVGPSIYGLIFAYTRSYRPAVLLCLLVLGGLFYLGLRTPDPRDA